MRSLAQIEPRLPVDALGGDTQAVYVISAPGSYYLTGPINGVSGKAAIAIAAANVTLDLNGFALNGVSGATRGIEIRDPGTAIVIRNGIVNAWPTAAIETTATAASNVRIEGISCQNNPGAGIRVVGAGSGVLIAQCNVTNGGGGIETSSSGFAVVRDCAVANLTLTGGVLSNGIIGAVVTGCTANAIGGSSTSIVGIAGASLENCVVSGVSNSVGTGAVLGINAQTARGCVASSINATSSTVTVIGITAVSATDSYVFSIGTTGQGTIVGINTGTVGTVSRCRVSNMGSSTQASVTGIAAQTVSDCVVTSLNGGGASGLLLGITADSVLNSRVTQLTSAGGSVSGITAGRVVQNCTVDSISQSSAASANAVGINSLRVTDCTVVTINANTSGNAASFNNFRSASGCVAGAVNNSAGGTRQCYLLPAGSRLEGCQANPGAGAVGIRAAGNAQILNNSVISGLTGIDASGAGSVIDGNNVSGCTTGINAAGVILVARNTVTNCTTRIVTDANCRVGPIVNTAGTITSTVATANFTD